MIRTCILLSTLLLAQGWSGHDVPQNGLSRRFWLDRTTAWFASGTGLAVVGVLPRTALAAPPKPPPKYLLERGSADKPLSACPFGKKNCWSTEDAGGRHVERWIPPADVSGKGSEGIFQELKSTIAMYPQEGQSGVDLGGWNQADEQQSAGQYYARYEFVSGKFKYVDDLEIRVDKMDGTVSARTASREGGYDYDVNKTRINYIMSRLREKGWQVELL